jgi:hypothetical protein
MALTNDQSHFSVLHAIIFPLLHKLPSTNLHHLIVVYSPPTPPKIMNDFPHTPPPLPLPPPPHVVAMGDEISHEQSPSREGKAQAASA